MPLSDCIPENDKTEVYRIPDYVRQAHSVAIIRGPLQSDNQHGNSLAPNDEENAFGHEELTKMLQVLGRRVWTFPVRVLPSFSNIIDHISEGNPSSARRSY